MKIYPIIILLLAVIISGCALIPYSETYTLNRTDLFPLEGYKLSKPYTVEKTNYTDEIIIYQDGITALKKNELTIYNFNATVKINSGTGIRFYLRSTYIDYLKSPSVYFDFTSSGTKVYDNNKLVADVDSVKLDFMNPSLIIIRQDAKYYEIIVDCDTVYKGISPKPGTEYIIIQTLNSVALVSGISIQELNGFEDNIITTNTEGEQNVRTNTETIAK